MLSTTSNDDRAGGGVRVDVEQYLFGLLMLAGELVSWRQASEFPTQCLCAQARFAVNAVAAGDCVRPVHIHRFVSQLDQSFRLLNLKNDNLRRKFDALKYDMQKVEQVVYDLTIRQLTPTQEQLRECACANSNGRLLTQFITF
jgi:hypothetical protein